MLRALVLIAGSLGMIFGCSVLDDSLVLPRCTTVEDCRGVVVGACRSARCLSGRCAPDVIDEDGDGFAEPECFDACIATGTGPCGARDCDDTSAAVYPGALEVCNGIDDDCNGMLDGPDEDDDGDDKADLCAGEAATDCDDSDPFTYQNAVQRCDGIDNDCFTAPGEEPAELLEDADGDGHSALDAPCENGYERDDCDDGNPLVYAGATEICDGLDNDCNGVPDDWRAGEPGSSCLPIDITAGDAHSCVRMVDQSVVCWGASDFRLGATNLVEGDGELAGTARVPGELRYLDVGAGQTGTCTVLDTGEVRCWGPRELVSPGSGRIPAPDTDRVGTVDGLAGATSVAVGANHACAVVPEGVACWGRAPSGAVNGVASTSIHTPVLLPATAGATQVDSSFTHSCAVVAGRVVCWGDPVAGGLGGTPLAGETWVVVPSIVDAAEVAVGRCFTCVRHLSGAVSCFGEERYEDDVDFEGPCTAPYRPEPRPVGGIDEAISLDAYSVHACAAMADGEVYCWGNNTTRQLGEGTPLDPSSGLDREGYDRTESDPVRVVGVDDATAVVAGSWHSCALGPNGAHCWGRQVRHRLGNGRSELIFQDDPRPVAAPVSVIRAPAQIAASDEATCFRMPDLSLRCTGSIAPLLTDQCYAGPLDGTPWDTVLTVQMAQRAVCGVTGQLRAPSEGGVVERVVRCQGSLRSHRFLGAADEDGIVALEAEAVAVVMGTSHACALDVRGAVSCWGDHARGQLGRDTSVGDDCRPGITGICSRVPLAVELPDIATDIAAGADHTCALLREGEVACWGNNDHGQLGRSPLSNINTVGLVEGLPTNDAVRSLSAAGETTCAIVDSGAAWCWGETVTMRPEGPAPQRLVELGSVEQIVLINDSTVGFFSRPDGHTGGLCARLSAGPVWCLGRNARGRLGEGPPVCTDVPSWACPLVADPVPSRFDDAVDLACGRYHCCATRRAGQVVCWGDRAGGQAADGIMAGGVYQTASTVELLTYGPARPAPACTMSL